MLIARSCWTVLILGLGFTLLLDAVSGTAARAEGLDTPAELAAPWQIASRKTRDGLDVAIYVETEKTPGRPAFRIETSFDVLPFAAAATLMHNMVMSDTPTTSGETRRVLERFERGAIVHTLIDLPFLFADRELAIRIDHSIDEPSGAHRIEWVDVNEVLPPVEDGVLRLSTEGYWEFRPDPPGRTSATYVSRAEVGGSLPAAVGDRLMKGQAVTAVERLGALIAERGQTHVSGSPPFDPPSAAESSD
jgi:hypothetical protein